MTSVEQPTENPLYTLYLDLNKFCTIKDYGNVIKISDKILKNFPEEEKAFHCKVIGYMQLNNFEAALRFIKGMEDIGNLYFEKAYCEYRLNRLEEAIKTIKSAPDSDLKLEELYCQILYKLENYEDSLNKYKSLIHNVHDLYDDERSVNMVANVAAMSLWQNKNRAFPNIPESIFDIYVNKACYLVANEKYDEALKNLKLAEEMCLKTLEDDDEITQNEIDEELCSIKVQQAYCLQMMNKLQEASNLYHDVLKKRCGENHILAVAANNAVCINRDQNIFDSKKKIKIATVENALSKLVDCQRQEISINNCLFLYYSNQSDTVKTMTTTLLKQSPKLVRAALIKTAQLVKDKQLGKAIAFLEDYLDIVDKTDIDNESLVKIQLTLAQLLLIQSSISRCYELLKELPVPYRHKFGILGTQISLCLIMENVGSAIECLDSSLEWYKAEAAAAPKGKMQEELKECYFSLLRVAAAFCERQKMPKDAARYYNDLLKLKPGDQGILASLIAAYSRFDKDLAEKTSLQLKDDSSLPEVDVDSLESTFIFGAKHMKKILKGEVTPGKSGDNKTVQVGRKSTGELKKKKKKKTKLPKNLDSNKMPDPERWLPKRERSYFKGRKRDKRVNMMRGPQGATGGSSELDASKKSGSSSIPATPNAEPIKSGQQQKTTVPAQSSGTTNTQQKQKSNPQFSKKNKSNKKRKR